MPPATAELILEIVRNLQTDAVATRAQIGELYTLIKGNGRPGLRQTQDELAAMVRQCADHRAREEAARLRASASAQSWAQFVLRIMAPFAIGALSMDIAQAVRAAAVM